MFWNESDEKDERRAVESMTVIIVVAPLAHPTTAALLARESRQPVEMPRKHAPNRPQKTKRVVSYFLHEHLMKQNFSESVEGAG